jgi:hypothetical protein
MIASSWVAASFGQSSVTASAGDLPEVGRANLGAPGLRAFLAVVRDQIVIPRNAV